MKKILLSTLIFAPIIAFSDDWTPPVTHSLMIMSEKELGTPKALKEENFNRQREMTLNGYVNKEENRYAQFLFGLKKNSFDEIRAFRGNSDPTDTHLKKSPNEIKLAFSYKKLPINEKSIIGYAPIGSYVEKPKEGWNGIKTFFEKDGLGICAYEFTDLKLSNGGVILEKEKVKYSVNNKPTLTLVEGSESSGYVYSVTWYNDTKVSQLDCASKSFNKDSIDKMIQFAKQIDKN